MIKKITFLGNFGVDFSSESHYKKTFEKLGIEVIALQEGQISSEVVLDNALQSDMFFWVHTHAWHTPGMAEVLKTLKIRNIPTIGYHLDLWKGLKREKDLETDEYWNIEYFFTCDKNFIPDLEAKRIKAYYLPAGVFEDECYLGTPRDEFKYDVVFTGSRGYHEEWPYRAELIRWLELTYGDRFAHFGGDGKKVVRGRDLNDLYASAKVVIGDTLCINFDYPDYFSDRLFEVPGRRGFMIFPYIKGLEDMFVLNKVYCRKEDKDKNVELLAYEFNNFLDLKNKIDFALTMNEWREATRLLAHERVKREHTYTHRLQYILSIINGGNTNQ